MAKKKRAVLPTMTMMNTCCNNIGIAEESANRNRKGQKGETVRNDISMWSLSKPYKENRSIVKRSHCSEPLPSNG
jgi:hypothetical protein